MTPADRPRPAASPSRTARSRGTGCRRGARERSQLRPRDREGVARGRAIVVAGVEPPLPLLAGPVAPRVGVHHATRLLLDVVAAHLGVFVEGHLPTVPFPPRPLECAKLRVG